MATIKYDVKREIIRFHKREDQMNVVEKTIRVVESRGGIFGGKQHKKWLELKQALIEDWMDDYLGSYARLTTWKELDRWAEEAKIPVTLIINCFGRLCRDSYGFKPSKNSVVGYASQFWSMNKSGVFD